ncbi:hypothetical protein TNCV_506711 [Trichonephila clavipes]|nr:hypothetical protein TNCV_506711 [Trichonephila clavipes]
MENAQSISHSGIIFECYILWVFVFLKATCTCWDLTLVGLQLLMDASKRSAVSLVTFVRIQQLSCEYAIDRFRQFDDVWRSMDSQYGDYYYGFP